MSTVRRKCVGHVARQSECIDEHDIEAKIEVILAGGSGAPEFRRPGDARHLGRRNRVRGAGKIAALLDLNEGNGASTPRYQVDFANRRFVPARNNPVAFAAQQHRRNGFGPVSATLGLTAGPGTRLLHRSSPSRAWDKSRARR